MFDREQLRDVLQVYKQDFVDKHWEEEKYKWQAVKHFQDHWDIHAEDFLAMFMEATRKTDNLLASRNFFPRAAIKDFATAEPEVTRALFIELFDEGQDIIERIQRFELKADKLKDRLIPGEGKLSYQNANAISTYLWLRYPDQYYIYKYTEIQSIAKTLNSEFVPKRGATESNLKGFFRLYDEISYELRKDEELVSLLQTAITDGCYPDPKLNTLTIDIGYYVTKFYSKGKRDKNESWFPANYNPEISVDEWIRLLKDREVFTENSLEVMKRFKDFGGAATCKQLSVKYGETANFYNTGSSSLAKRVHNKTGCPLLTGNTENSKWWPILYLGRYTTNKEDGVYMWKLRDELSLALEQIDLSSTKLYSTEVHDENRQFYHKDLFLDEVYMNSDRYDTLVSLLKKKKNLILQGAPGVGKTFAAKRLAYSMMGVKDDSRIEFVQFHQNYSYEDFVLGYKPMEDRFVLQQGTFYRLCQKAANHPDEDYFFIIDEINRGNISKIFGELLMLIEKEYRGEKISLAYSGTSFAVPENVYIIGMMNTSDRSLAMIDYALRRRFSFFEMEMTMQELLQY